MPLLRQSSKTRSGFLQRERQARKKAPLARSLRPEHARLVALADRRSAQLATETPPASEARSMEEEWMDVAAQEAVETEQHEKTMFLDGKWFLPPNVHRWRRFLLKLVTCRAALIRSTIAEAMRGAQNSPHISASECSHPQYALRRSGNQYAKYVHCLLCQTRLHIERNLARPQRPRPPP